MKPIEKGCMAIIIDGAGEKRNVGKIVTVGSFIGEIEGFCGNNNWNVDQPILFTGGEYKNFIQQSYLERIDDGETPITKKDLANEKLDVM